LSYPVQPIPAAVAYGRASGRLRAYLIDWVIMLLLLVAVLFTAVSAESNKVGRILGFGCFTSRCWFRSLEAVSASFSAICALSMTEPAAMSAF
jgi:uncharacterized RDD family membrane protein YckC